MRGTLLHIGDKPAIVKRCTYLLVWWSLRMLFGGVWRWKHVATGWRIKLLPRGCNNGLRADCCCRIALHAPLRCMLQCTAQPSLPPHCQALVLPWISQAIRCAAAGRPAAAHRLLQGGFWHCLRAELPSAKPPACHASTMLTCTATVHLLAGERAAQRGLCGLHRAARLRPAHARGAKLLNLV